MSNVEYRLTPGIEGYRVGSDGSVWSAWKRKGLGPGNGQGTVCFIGDSWKRLTQFTMKGKRPGRGNSRMLPYRYVRMRVSGGKYACVHVHKLVTLAFIGPRPEGTEVRHLDGDHANNVLGNLCYGTHKQNMKDRSAHGRMIGEGHPLARLTNADILQIRQRRSTGEGRASIAKEFGITTEYVSKISSRRAWRHVA